MTNRSAPQLISFAFDDETINNEAVLVTACSPSENDIKNINGRYS